MPTAENSSAGKTFSMSRWAMMLPIVARRSPAITTPPAKVAATIVVPCGARSPACPAGTRAARRQQVGRLAGRGSRRTTTCRASGTPPAAAAGVGVELRSLAALLDERLHEVLGVVLEDLVDLVEDGVDVVVERLLALGDVGLGGDLLGGLLGSPRTCAAASAPVPCLRPYRALRRRDGRADASAASAATRQRSQ